jgi:hypothetical protein
MLERGARFEMNRRLMMLRKIKRLVDCLDVPLFPSLNDKKCSSTH